MSQYQSKIYIVTFSIIYSRIYISYVYILRISYSVNNQSQKSNYNIEGIDELTKDQLNVYWYDWRMSIDKIFCLGTVAVNLIGTFIRRWRRNDDGWKDEPTGGKSASLIRSQNAAAKLRSR